MKKILLVIDMQNDFIDAALGTKEAVAIVENVKSKIKTYEKSNIFATRDTHEENYLETQEGKYLPVRHCIRGSEGWKIRKDIQELLNESNIYDKPTFGSVKLAQKVKELYENEKGELEVEICGLCTDICVISNALLLKANAPEMKISLDPKCCAGVTPEKHNAAIEAMRSCQIQIL